MVAQPKRMSVAEFMALPDDGNRHELVVHIHDAAAPTRIVRGTESLTDEALLPGFVLRLNLIFPEL